MRTATAALGAIGALTVALLIAAPVFACTESGGTPTERGCETGETVRVVPSTPSPVVDLLPVPEAAGQPVDPVIQVPAPAVERPSQPRRVSPATTDAGADRVPANTLERPDGLPFTGPRPATLLVLAGLLFSLGAGSLLTTRYQARH